MTLFQWLYKWPPNRRIDKEGHELNHLEIANFKSTIFEDEVNFSPIVQGTYWKNLIKRLTTLKKNIPRLNYSLSFCAIWYLSRIDLIPTVRRMSPFGIAWLAQTIFKRSCASVCLKIQGNTTEFTPWVRLFFCEPHDFATALLQDSSQCHFRIPWGLNFPVETFLVSTFSAFCKLRSFHHVYPKLVGGNEFFYHSSRTFRVNYHPKLNLTPWNFS